MLTQGADDTGFWLTVSDLAKRKGVSKQALSKRVDRLEKQGLLSSKVGERRTRLVNVAEFDRAVGEATDAVRELNGTLAQQIEEPAAVAPSIASGLANEQRRRAGYDADLKELELAERQGRLIPVDDALRAMQTCAGTMVRVIERIQARAGEVAAAVAKDGESGARAFLRGFARDLREELARSMVLLQGGDKDPEADEEG